MTDEEKKQQSEQYIKALEGSNSVAEKAIRSAIRNLGLFDGCRILDVPCGIGNHVIWMAEENQNIYTVGVDFDEMHLNYAKKLAHEAGYFNSPSFEQGDINKLGFEDNSFDFIWCCDGLWPGPIEMGCLAEQPYDILKDMARVTKSGGTIAILFWSGQKLLPGYPLVEARLNASETANMPVTKLSNPELHYMRTPLWLKRTGLRNIKSQTFVADLQGPFGNQEKENLLALMKMFWGRSETEVLPSVWKQYKTLTNGNPDDCIINRDDYTGFITYTMFTGEVL